MDGRRHAGGMGTPVDIACADAAGSRGSQVGVITQAGNIDARRIAGLQYGLTFGDGDLDPIHADQNGFHGR
jgi:hypothetical protein